MTGGGCELDRELFVYTECGNEKNVEMGKAEGEAFVIPAKTWTWLGSWDPSGCEKLRM